MLRSGLLTALWAGSLAITLVVPAFGQDAAPSSSVSEIPVPGGLRGALAAVGDTASPDRARFLAEFIRRMYDTPFGVRGDVREPVVQSLVARLDAGGSMDETVPLPLSVPFWLDVVFRGKITRRDLLSSILQSRGAALFYSGLLSLDDDTRAWIGAQPSLVSEIVSRRPAAFLVAAPGLRVASGRVRTPGGEAADPVWQALVGRHGDEPAEFMRALLACDQGRLAYFFGAMAQLTPLEIRFAMNLDNADAAARVSAGRRLYAVFDRLWNGRGPEMRVFTRPPYDPMLLVSELTTYGPLRVPGTRSFWIAAFSEEDANHPRTPADRAKAAAGADDAADFPWLCEQLFKGELNAYRTRYLMVLFAARHGAGMTRDSDRDALEAVRATATYPALVAALERARITDLSVFASAARRAAALNGIQDQSRTARAFAQFQGAVAMVTRAAWRGTVTPASATALLSSLAAIPVSQRGDYEGRVVAWLGAWLKTAAPSPKKPSPDRAGENAADDVYENGAAGPLEEDALGVLIGPPAGATRIVDWEGTRYRIDLAGAEAVKLTRAHGPSARPYLSAASTALAMAEALADPALTAEALRHHVESLARLWRAEPDEPEEDFAGDPPGSYREVSSSLQRAGRSNDLKAAARLAPALRLLADDLVARGLMEWAYAAALGPNDGVSISAGDAASRHDFGLRSGLAGHPQAWRLAAAGTDPMQRWRVAGSLLGLDVALAKFSLVALSSKPPPHRPTLSDIDRRTFIEGIALVEPRLLTDADRDAIATAIRKGRARLEAVRAPADAYRIADQVGLSPASRTLFGWTVAHDPSRVNRFLSELELFWLGADGQRPDALDAWGAPAVSRLGCLCLQVIERRPWETVAGRWSTGMTASAFPDLNLRLAEFLAELHMPAELLGPVLTAAVLEFVNSAMSRDPDDRRALVDFIQSLGRERLEMYLALLTTDGPLVPLGDVPAGKGSGDPDGGRRQEGNHR